MPPKRLSGQRSRKSVNPGTQDGRKRWTMLLKDDVKDAATDMQAIYTQEDLKNFREADAEGTAYHLVKFDGISTMAIIMVQKAKKDEDCVFNVIPFSRSDEQVNSDFTTTYNRTCHITQDVEKLSDSAKDWVQGITENKDIKHRIIDVTTNFDKPSGAVYVDPKPLKKLKNDSPLHLKAQKEALALLKLSMALGCPEAFVFKTKELPDKTFLYCKVLMLEHRNCMPITLTIETLREILDVVTTTFDKYGKLAESQVGALVCRCERIHGFFKGNRPGRKGTRDTNALVKLIARPASMFRGQDIDPTFVLLYSMFDTVKPMAYQCFVSSDHRENIFDLSAETNCFPFGIQSASVTCEFPKLGQENLINKYARLVVAHFEESTKSWNELRSLALINGHEGFVVMKVKDGTLTVARKVKFVSKHAILPSMIKPALQQNPAATTAWSDDFLLLFLDVIYPAYKLKSSDDNPVKRWFQNTVPHVKCDMAKVLSSNASNSIPDQASIVHPTSLSSFYMQFYRVDVSTKTLVCNKPAVFQKRAADGTDANQVPHLVVDLWTQFKIQREQQVTDSQTKTAIDKILEIHDKFFVDVMQESDNDDLQTMRLSENDISQHIHWLQSKLSYNIEARVIEDSNKQYPVPPWVTLSPTANKFMAWPNIVSGIEWFKLQTSWYNDSVWREQQKLYLTAAPDHDIVVERANWQFRANYKLNNHKPSEKPSKKPGLWVAHGVYQSSGINVSSNVKDEQLYFNQNVDDTKALVFTNSITEKTKSGMQSLKTTPLIESLDTDAGMTSTKLIQDIVIESYIFLLVIAGLDAGVLSLQNISACNNELKYYILQVVKFTSSVSDEFKWPENGWLARMNEARNLLYTAMNSEDVCGDGDGNDDIQIDNHVSDTNGKKKPKHTATTNPKKDTQQPIKQMPAAYNEMMKLRERCVPWPTRFNKFIPQWNNYVSQSRISLLV